jgi:hypothetical protein
MVEETKTPAVKTTKTVSNELVEKHNQMVQFIKNTIS